MTAVRTEAAYAAAENDDALEAELSLAWFYVGRTRLASLSLEAISR